MADNITKGIIINNSDRYVYSASSVNVEMSDGNNLQDKINEIDKLEIDNKNELDLKILNNSNTINNVMSSLNDEINNRINYSTEFENNLKNGTFIVHKSTNDENGNNINDTYAKLSGSTFNGPVNIGTSNTSNNFNVFGQSQLQNTVINGTLTINGDLVQTGNTYNSNSEHLMVKDAIIYTRNGAVSGLVENEYTGIIAKKYDGINNGLLVFDNTGTARVGDENDTAALMTRDDVMENNGIIYWNNSSLKSTNTNTFYIDKNKNIFIGNESLNNKNNLTVNGNIFLKNGFIDITEKSSSSDVLKDNTHNYISLYGNGTSDRIFNISGGHRIAFKQNKLYVNHFFNNKFSYSDDGIQLLDKLDEPTLNVNNANKISISVDNSSTKYLVSTKTTSLTNNSPLYSSSHYISGDTLRTPILNTNKIQSSADAIEINKPISVSGSITATNNNITCDSISANSLKIGDWILTIY